jgi:hypothetical protein
MEETEDGELTADGSRQEKPSMVRKSLKPILNYSINSKERESPLVRRSMASDAGHRRVGSYGVGITPQGSMLNLNSDSKRLKKVEEDQYLLKVLKEAENLAYEPKRISLAPALEVKLPAVIHEQHLPRLSIEALLAALRFEEPKRELEECTSVEELADRIVNHVSGSLPAPYERSVQPSLAGLDRAVGDDPSSLIQENKRLKGVIHKLQNDKNYALSQSESDRNKSLSSEVENLKRQVADMIDLLKRREDEAGCSVLLLKGKSQDKSTKSYNRSLTTRSQKVNTASSAEWQVIVAEQKSTIENLSTLVGNLRLEIGVLLGRLKLLEKTPPTAMLIEGSRDDQPSPQKPDLAFARQIGDLRARIQTISRSNGTLPPT